MAQLAQIANLPPEQREVRMRQMHERVQNRVQELRKQQEAGPLAPQEQRQLENLQAVNTRLEELSRLSPEERDARLSALREMAARNGNGPRQGGPGFGRGPGGRGFGPGPDGLNQNQQRRPFPPVEGDPNNLPPKPAASDTPARTQQNS
jgi:hypothetical protein